MTLEPRVSVLMLVYNLENFVSQAIEGALMQETTFPIEIVIGEDCSTDNSKQICLDFERRFPEKVRVLRRPENFGLMANFADTLKNCRGEYVAFCDGDDYWTDPQKLQKQVDFLETNSEYVLCHHDFVSVDDSGKVLEGLYPQRVDIDYERSEMALGSFMKSNSLLFRNVQITFPDRSLDRTLKIVNNDTFLICLLSKFGKAKYLPNIGPSVYRVHGSSNFSSLDRARKLESELKTFEFVKISVDKAFRGSIDAKLFKLNYLRYVSLKRSGNRFEAFWQVLIILYRYPVRLIRLLIKYNSPFRKRKVGLAER